MPCADSRVISGDACASDYVELHKEFKEFLDVYSNNVLEHFERPWIAASNLEQLF